MVKLLCVTYSSLGLTVHLKTGVYRLSIPVIHSSWVPMRLSPDRGGFMEAQSLDHYDLLVGVEGCDTFNVSRPSLNVSHPSEGDWKCDRSWQDRPHFKCPNFQSPNPVNSVVMTPGGRSSSPEQGCYELFSQDFCTIGGVDFLVK